MGLGAALIDRQDFHAHQAAGLHPVKINAVLPRGVNDAEAADLLRWAIGQGLALRLAARRG